MLLISGHEKQRGGDAADPPLGTMRPAGLQHRHAESTGRIGLMRAGKRASACVYFCKLSLRPHCSRWPCCL
jgi:hypothetical protein